MGDGRTVGRAELREDETSGEVYMLRAGLKEEQNWKIRFHKINNGFGVDDEERDENGGKRGLKEAVVITAVDGTTAVRKCNFG